MAQMGYDTVLHFYSNKKIVFFLVLIFCCLAFSVFFLSLYFFAYFFSHYSILFSIVLFQLVYALLSEFLLLLSHMLSVPWSTLAHKIIAFRLVPKTRQSVYYRDSCVINKYQVTGLNSIYCTEGWHRSVAKITD